MSGSSPFHNENSSQEEGALNSPEIAAGLRLAVVNSAFSNGFPLETDQSSDWVAFLDQYRADATLAGARFPADVAMFHFNRAQAILRTGDSEQADGEFIEALRFAARLAKDVAGRSEIIVAAHVNRASIALGFRGQVDAQVDTLDRLLAESELSSSERLAVGLNLFLLQEKRTPGSGSLSLLETAVSEGKKLPPGGVESGWLVAAASKLGMRLFEAGEVDAAMLHLKTALAAASVIGADEAQNLIPVRFYLQLGLAMQGRLEEAGELAGALLMQLSACSSERMQAIPIMLITLSVYASHLVVNRRQDEAVRTMQQIARLGHAAETEVENLSRGTFRTVLKGLRESGRRAEAKILSRFLL